MVCWVRPLPFVVMRYRNLCKSRLCCRARRLSIPNAVLRTRLGARIGRTLARGVADPLDTRVGPLVPCGITYSLVEILHPCGNLERVVHLHVTHAYWLLFGVNQIGYPGPASQSR